MLRDYLVYCREKAGIRNQNCARGVIWNKVFREVFSDKVAFGWDQKKVRNLSDYGGKNFAGTEKLTALGFEHVAYLRNSQEVSVAEMKG